MGKSEESCLTDLQRRTERAGDAANEVARSAGNEIGYIIGTMVAVCVGEAGASAVA